ncbi:MAG: helix-turn-helix domain-containing protein [Halothermotrichaceae bacterium]
MENFAVRLKKLRKEKELRQTDLAQKLGVAQTTIANYEQNSRFPNQELLIKIANFFNISIDYLLGRSDYLNEQEKKDDNHQSHSPQLLPAAEKYLNMLLRGNERQAYSVVTNQIQNKNNLEDIYIDIFEPSLKKIGYLWVTNKINVAEEHYFTNKTRQIMSTLYSHFPKLRENNKTMLGVCAHGELHELGLRIVVDFFKLDGWKTYYLGNNTPTDSLINIIKNNKINILAISGTINNSINTTKSMITTLRSEFNKKDLKIIVGGKAFGQENHWKETGADGYAENAKKAIKIANKLV